MFASYHIKRYQQLNRLTTFFRLLYSFNMYQQNLPLISLHQKKAEIHVNVLLQPFHYTQ